MISQRVDLLDQSSALKLHAARSRAPSPFPLRLLARWLCWVPAAVRWRGLYPPPADAPARQPCIFSPSLSPLRASGGIASGDGCALPANGGTSHLSLRSLNTLLLVWVRALLARGGTEPPARVPRPAYSARAGSPVPAFPGSPPLSRESGSRYAPFFLG